MLQRQSILDLMGLAEIGTEGLSPSFERKNKQKKAEH